MQKSIVIFVALFATFARAAGGAQTAPTATASFTAGSVHIDQYGSGSPALVLIPGLTDSGKVWDSTVARYQGAHTIYVLTLPGFGGEPKVAAPMLDAVARDIAAFLPKANKPVVIGHSLGGFMAIRLAEEHSDLMSGVVAIDGLPVFPGLDAQNQAVRSAIADQGASQMTNLSQAEFEAGQRAQLAYMTEPPNVDAALTYSKGADIGASAEYMREMLAADLRPALSRITVPLLEIGPFDSTLDPTSRYTPEATAANKQKYYSSLFAGDPAAKVVIIDNSRHFIMLDQPVALFAAIDAFLARIP